MKIKLIFLILWITVSVTNAQVLLDETFEYTEGPIQNLSTWITEGTFSTPLNGGRFIVPGALVYSNAGGEYSLSGLGKTVNSLLTASTDYKSYRTFTSAPYNSGLLYLSFLFKAGITQSQGNAEIMSLAEGSSSGAKILVGKGITTGTYRFATSRGSSSSVDYEWGLTEFTDINQVMLLVVKYDFSTQISSLFINPLIGSTSEPTPEIIDDNSTTIRATLNGIRFRSQGSSAARFNVSGVRVSTTWTAAVAVPAIKLETPVAGAASDISESGFTAHWTQVANSKSYNVLVYQDATLISTTNADGQTTESIAITGLASNTAYTYIVQAKGDGVIYSLSNPSDPSPVYTTLGLSSPVTGSATDITSSGFTANWTPVANATGYDVQVYFRTSLISTASVDGQSAASKAITGLTMGTSYTYRVVAKGNGTTDLNSTPSLASSTFLTLPLSVDYVNSNFGDGNWGIVTPPPSALLPSALYSFSYNGFGVVDGVLYGSTPTGLKGEVHTNVIRLNKNVNSKFELPAVNSVKQIELHVSGTDQKSFCLKEYNSGTLSWVVVGDTLWIDGTLENIFIDTVSRNVPTKFRIENTSTSSLNINQVITRNTTPTLLNTPVIDTVSLITGSGFTAHWTPMDTSATGYKILVYTTNSLGVTSLRDTILVSDKTSSSFAVTNVDTAAICSYRVVALGDGDILYSDSYISDYSPGFSIVRLSTPEAGLASDITSSGFMANWTSVTGAKGYDILVYQGAILFSTSNVTGESTSSLIISGIPTNAVYYFSVIAKGDGIAIFDSKESVISSGIAIIPTVSAPTVTSITTNGATIGGTIESGATPLERGTVWGITAIPLENAQTEGGTNVGAFSHVRIGMTPNTLYFFRAFAGFTAGTAYSADGSFTTLSLAPVKAAATNVFEKEFTANWTAPANQGSELFTFTLEVSTDISFATGVVSTADLSSGTFSKVITGLTGTTNYYYRVMVVNASGNSAYSAIESVITLSAGLPKLTEMAASQITTDGAILGGVVTNSVTALTSRGTVWGSSPNPSGNILAAPGTTVDAFSHVRTGMTPNTHYYFRAYGINSAGTGYSADGTFTTLSLAPTTAPGSNISATGFTANWAGPATQGAEAITYTFELSSDITFSSGVTTTSAISVSTLSKVISGLTASTNYYYRVMAVNATGNSAYSATETVTTSVATEPVLTTPTATLITTTGATLGGTVISNGGASLIARGTVWGTAANPTANIMNASGTTLDAFSHERSGMLPNTRYYFRAYATNNAVTGYSPDGSFTTLSLPPTIALPINVTPSGFTANWAAPLSQGLASYTFTIEVSADNTFATGVTSVSGVSENSVSKAITGLSFSTLYYYRVMVVNAGGNSEYSGISSFTTLSYASLPTATLITTAGATLGGTVMTNADALPSGRGTVWGTSPNPTGNMLLEGGTGIGAFSHIRTGLTPNTSYYFRAFANYGTGTGYSPDGTFTTLSLAPIIASVSNVNPLGFTANWLAPPAQGNAGYYYVLQVSMDNTFINGVLTLSYISSGTTSYPIPWADPTTSYFYRVGVINAGGNSEFSAYKTVKTYAIGISNPNQEKSIYSFYPNPVINNLNFEYVLLNNSSVQLAIYNLNGQMVKTLLNYGQQTVGSYSESFDVSGLERGIYLARFTTGACAETFKIVIAK